MYNYNTYINTKFESYEEDQKKEKTPLILFSIFSWFFWISIRLDFGIEPIKIKKKKDFGFGFGFFSIFFVFFLRLVASPTLIKKSNWNPIEIQKKSNWNPIEIKKNQKKIKKKSKKTKKNQISKKKIQLKSNWNRKKIQKNRKNYPKKPKKTKKIQNNQKKNRKTIQKKSKQNPIFLWFFWNDVSSLIHNRIEIQLKS